MGDLLAYRYAFEDFPTASAAEEIVAIETSFLASLSDAGSGQVAILNEDNQPGLGDLVVFEPHGQRAFVMMCDEFDRVAVDPTEGGGKITTWSGLGHLGVFRRGLLGPPGGVDRAPIVDDLVFNYTHPDFDDSAWVNATQIESVAGAKLTWPIISQQPWGDVIRWTPDMPDGTPTYLVGPSSGTTTSAPTGDCYLRDTFTTPYDGMHLIYATADNVAEIFIDGKSITTVGGSGNVLQSGFTNVTIVPVQLTAGVEHTVAIRLTNAPPSGSVSSPTAVAAQVWIPGFETALIVWQTTGAMTIEEYPDEEPGMTPGTVLRLLLEEQQAAGRLGFVDLGFDDENDSANEPWPTFATIATKVGTDCYSFLKEIAATYADLEMDPNGWTLNAWVWGTKGSTSGVTIETGNVTSLRQRGEDTVADEVLIRWDGGWTTRGSGDVQALLELGPQTSVDEVARVGDQIIDVFNHPREEISFTYEPREDADPIEFPFVNPDFVLGSTLTVDDSTATPTLERVMEIGCTEDNREERILVQVTVKDLILQAQERIVQAVKP